MMSLESVIDIRADDADLSALQQRNPKIRKIVIGDSPTGRSARGFDLASLPSLESNFENLTHVYVWNSSGLARVPIIADGLQVLEIRASSELTSIELPPASLESLILEDCPHLDLPPPGGRSFPQLRELSLGGCPQITPQRINEWIGAAENLEYLDLSRCPQLIGLPVELPEHLTRLELNDCTAICSLPDPLPFGLVRLGLRNARALEEVPDLSRTQLDYLDLAFTTTLTKVPRFPELRSEGGVELSEEEKQRAARPRTLFLFGSSVLAPPASEHGSTATVNVARETREYQDEVDLVDSGQVRRCKLLLLGNGSAGKTKLALELHPDRSKEPVEKGGDYPGTTHGVQLWDWKKFEAGDAARKRAVHLHMWDFGGQEIYHSTHRLFVSRGSVFVVVWNPAQDGNQPDPQGAYHDTYYPVRYWLDYIHAECPHNRPVVAIVCSHQGDRWKRGDADANAALKSELKDRLRADIGDEYADRIPLYVFDAEAGAGEREDLERWLSESVLKVVETQGTVVPTYWEIAQNMVEDSLPKPKRDASDRSTGELTHENARPSLDEFTDKLRAAITKALNESGGNLKYRRLREHWDEGRFLTPRRVERTLRFLTHSGWVYWDKELTDSRVIIDQPWALQTIYTTLQRDPAAKVYADLVQHEGRFTFEQLQQWCWAGSDKLDEADQQLIVSFMVSVGVIYPISHRYWSEKTTYISPNHLPDSGLAGDFGFDDSGEEGMVESKHLHRGHWFAVMRELCKRYGEDGTYARNECVVRGSTYRWDREHNPWSVLLRFELDDEKRGLGGKIRLRARGAQLGDRLASMKRFVESFMPGFAGHASDIAAEFDRACHGPIEDGAETGQRKKAVFFSYAWDPEDKKGYYEEPVDAIYEGLLPYVEQQRVELMRDKKTLEPGDYISEYVAKAGSQDVDLVLVFTSDKYWRSWWCMLEFCSLWNSLTHSSKGIETSVLVVEHESGRLKKAGDVNPILEYWDSDKARDEFPAPLMAKGFHWQFWRDKFKATLVDCAPAITSDVIGLRKVWSPTQAGEIIDWVKTKLGL